MQVDLEGFPSVNALDKVPSNPIYEITDFEILGQLDKKSFNGILSQFNLVLFDEPNVENVLRTLKPNIHAKGTDYTAETIPERAVVAEYGGKVAVCGDPKDHSSTELIEKTKG